MTRALYVLALAVFAMGTSEFMLAGLVPDIAADVGVPVGTAGLLTSAFALGMVVGAPTMAALTRRLPARATLLGCLVLFALAHVVGAVTPSFAVLFTTRLVAAVADAGFLAVALSTAATLVAPDRKGRAVAVLLSGTTVAMVAGVPAGALLGTATGWRSTFWAVALVCVPATLGIARGIPRARRADHASVHAVGGPSLRTELAALASPRLVLPMVLAALVNTGTFAALTFLAPLVTDVAGLSPWWVAIALVLFGVGSFVGVTVAGRVSDRSPRVVVTVGGVLLLLGWVATAAFAAHPAALLGLVLVQGALGFAVGSTLITRVLYAAARAPSMGGSYATAALNVGAAAGPAVAAATLATGLGEVGPVWVAAAATATALLLAAPLLRVVAPAQAGAAR
ncbi:Cmx/CmrA family chloramphenicol efflux MFS transporter [Cellulosimicrobium composti]|uniref:Cmx/CmrA family chloramphenicol efflux MFS transporter n=1 Tax=Cellulosimicrobium composti TaxID=2672572 RepID=UPI003789409B